ncbi:Uncharacterised protein [Legionella busanensis]|uniref:Uncharacterized protein n=1 Tax=Legionella busanensis TaxID=190655 RepID=A0A378JMN9_9GAMM|nr:hypothetical protein [Legionella busanensis]STX51469.1 Uncharacterised protein [Legionella busanensis]
MESFEKVILLSNEKSFLRNISIKSLEQWERALLKDLNFNVQVDEDEAIRLLQPHKIDLPLK